jgi:arylsulfatase A-like enzyme
MFPTLLCRWRAPWSSLAIVILVAWCSTGASGIFTDSLTIAAEAKPNVVILVADDWSWPHASALGDPVVKTPNFDRVAAEGVLFENAFVSTPSCTPSRLSVLTGQHHWRLQEGDSLGGSLREKFDVYTEMLRDSGYRIGRFGKGVWPSKHSFRHRDSFGERFRSFDQFLENRKPGEPFCYWHGGQDPHRSYDLNIGARSGIDLSQVRVPACLPDNETVRGDVADYLWEVQRFDGQIGEVISRLEAIGELENTIIVVSSDNGMPFPRCKATLYDQGTRVPLAIRWGAKVTAGRSVSDFTSLCDLAPTIVEAAGLEPSAQMTGRSLMPQLLSDHSGQIDPQRTFVVTGMEKHVYSYPSRALRTNEFLYIRNFDPDNWPTGEINGGQQQYDFATESWPTEQGAFSFNIDPSPSKQLLRLNRNDDGARRFARLAFARRPSEELYELKSDPDQLHNIVDDRKYARARRQLRRQLDAELIKSRDPRVSVPGYHDRDLVGWPLRVSDTLMREQTEDTELAIEILEEQFLRMLEILPASVVAQLRRVPIWMSPPYEGARPTAEYHPDGGWLRKAGRRDELAQCVELTNIGIFEKEYRRMPMLILHELSHAYHHQVLSFDHPDIKTAYETARESGTYESVRRHNGKTEQAYGITNHKEYFAESSEALFGRNDFYPFNRLQLKRHDPAMHALLIRLWKSDGVNAESSAPTDYEVTAPPAELKLLPFYKKYVDASGYPVISSEQVNDYALKEAAYLIDMMLAERPDLRRTMVASGSRMIVIAHNEFTTDIPEYKQLRPVDYWDARARGLGGSREEPVCSCAEENVLAYEGDPYSTENILIHEFAHNIHLRGMVNLDPTFDDRLKQSYDRAMSQGLWKSKYAATNHAEYFAEGVQSWFNNNRPPDHDHNHVDTRDELREYDPGLASICEEVFGATNLVYTKPQTRLSGHLAGYDPESSPKFEWPERLKKAKEKIREDVKERGENRKKEYKN